MRKRDRKVLAKYIRATADSLGLRDWTFELQHDPCDDEALASVHPCEGRRVATICVCGDFRSRKRAEQRQTIVHELLHCHHAAASDIIRVDLVKQLSQSTYDVVFFGFRRQMEYMVDAVAEAIAGHFPLIEWPDA